MNAVINLQLQVGARSLSIYWDALSSGPTIHFTSNPLPYTELHEMAGKVALAGRTVSYQWASTAAQPTVTWSGAADTKA